MARTSLSPYARDVLSHASDQRLYPQLAAMGEDRHPSCSRALTVSDVQKGVDFCSGIDRDDIPFIRGTFTAPPCERGGTTFVLFQAEGRPGCVYMWRVDWLGLAPRNGKWSSRFAIPWG